MLSECVRLIFSNKPGGNFLTSQNTSDRGLILHKQYLTFANKVNFIDDKGG